MHAPLPALRRHAAGIASLVLLLVPLAGPAGAVDLSGNADQQYQACLTLTDHQPSEAFEAALAWHARGGGLPADHCAALALVGLKQYEEAASRLESLAQALDKTGSELTPAVLDQAANAWLLGNQPERAIGAADAALKLTPNVADYHTDRARAYAALGQYGDAAKDLDAAIAIDPKPAEAYGFRAAARRHLGDIKGALADANAAVARDPDAVGALLERGILQQSSGNKAAARQDWLKVLQLAPGSPAAAAARDNLERMDMRLN